MAVAQQQPTINLPANYFSQPQGAGSGMQGQGGFTDYLPQLAGLLGAILPFILGSGKGQQQIKRPNVPKTAGYTQTTVSEPQENKLARSLGGWAQMMMAQQQQKKGREQALEDQKKKLDQDLTKLWYAGVIRGSQMREEYKLREDERKRTTEPTSYLESLGLSAKTIDAISQNAINAGLDPREVSGKNIRQFMPTPGAEGEEPVAFTLPQLEEAVGFGFLSWEQAAEISGRPDYFDAESAGKMRKHYQSRDVMRRLDAALDASRGAEQMLSNMRRTAQNVTPEQRTAMEAPLLEVFNKANLEAATAMNEAEDAGWENISPEEYKELASFLEANAEALSNLPVAELEKRVLASIRDEKTLTYINPNSEEYQTIILPIILRIAADTGMGQYRQDQQPGMWDLQ